MVEANPGTVETAPPIEKPRPPKRQRPVLKIVLDTNQLYTGSASDLLQAGLRGLIEGSRSHRDIELEWYIPDVVRGEREYQMIQAALELLPAIGRLERLLGHQLGINHEILESRVKDAIDRQVKDLKLVALPLEEKSVDWKTVIRDALRRNPPFERGKTEKGFRDRLVAESFLQLVSKSPKTPSVCRVALVTGDLLLAEVVEAATKSSSNVRVLRSLEDLQNLLNTLVASVTEEFVSSVRQLAQELFFKEGSEDGFYFVGKIPEAARTKFPDALKETPPNADHRENGTWYINPPSFVEKVGQKITWSTTIRVESTAYRKQKRSSPPGATGPQGMAFGDWASQPAPGSLWSMYGTGTPLGLETASPWSLDPGKHIGGQLVVDSPYLLAMDKVQVAKGSSTFHVFWNTTVTAAHKLKGPKLERIEFAGTVWE